MSQPSDAAMMAIRANEFLRLLFPPQKDQAPGAEYALFDFAHENRFAMHYLVPSSRLRRGLPLRAMNGPQASAARALLQASLGAEGYRKVDEIQKLEHILMAAEKLDQPGSFRRDPESYYVAIFGEPRGDGTIDPEKPWGWRFEGHHISLHWTVIGERIIASTPQFLGSQPARVLPEHAHPQGPPVGTKVLAKEGDLARQLAQSLSANQRRKAVISVPWDIETSNVIDPVAERNPPLLEARGIPRSDMQESQRRTLEELVHAYAETQLEAVVRERLARIDAAGWDAVRFRWMGSFAEGEPQSYLVILPGVFLIEYNNWAFNTPQHEHTVWRDLQDDWGRKSLAGLGADPVRRHMATAEHHAVDRLRAALVRTSNDPGYIRARLEQFLAERPHQHDGRWHSHAAGAQHHRHHHHGEDEHHDHGHHHHRHGGRDREDGCGGRPAP